jgi:hypothetical protein
MRTVTFSQPDVIRTMETNFVSTWFNQAPEQYPILSHTAAIAAGVREKVACDCLSAQGVRKEAARGAALPKATLPPGAGGTNVKIFFCAPDGRILNYLQGHWTPREFTDHAAFSLELLRVYERGGNENDLRQDITDMHRQCEQGHVREAQRLQQELRGGGLTPGQVARAQEEINAQNIRAQCHRIAVQRLFRDPKPYMNSEQRVIH